MDSFFSKKTVQPMRSLALVLFIFSCLALVVAGSKAMAAEQEVAGDLQPAIDQQPAVDPDKDREASLEWGQELYGHYCTPCHGIRGDGNGFNAHKLIVKPANHSDAKFMSERNDQKLFDTINLGGVEVAKSTLMPPWGAALNNDNKIKSLILKLRDLCQCQATKNW